MRIGSIVVAHDLSKRSNRAVRRALQLASDSGTIAVVHAVTDGDDPRKARRALEAQLGQVAGWREGAGREVLVEVGDPVEAVGHVVRRLGAQLLAFGVHGKRGLFDAVMTTTSSRIARASEVPALMAVQAGRKAYSRVLVSMDYEASAVDALRTVGNWLPKASIDVFHALDLNPGRRSASTSASAAKLEAARLDWLRPLIVRAIGSDRASSSVARVEAIVRSGPPNDLIRKVALERKSDLIVVGTQDKSALGRFMFGSVTRMLMADPPTDLLIVRPSGD